MSDVARPLENADCPLPPRRGLNRVQAAGYVGVGTSKFDAMIQDGRMPKAKRIDGRRVWDRRALDAAFDRLLDDAQTDANPWDD
ncbi:helix-turn-helix transcriptional regulator [Roseovarius pacificus]|uniref:helix-turn-helix transcriptional regulator n=1 Tax=Roseovarius pacificus TaxID=337701 RepID=UPI00403A4802